MDIQLSLPHFQQAIKQDRPDGLPADTHRRYSAGKVPRTFVNLLIKRPDLARALIRDIEALAHAENLP